MMGFLIYIFIGLAVLLVQALTHNTMFDEQLNDTKDDFSKTYGYQSDKSWPFIVGIIIGDSLRIFLWPLIILNELAKLIESRRK